MGRWQAMLLVLGVGGGCIGPEETRYLSFYQRAPDVEARSYDYHDPFPDESAGPDTYTRPRSFSEPRSDTRKNVDLRFLQAMHPTAGRPELAGVPIVRGPARPGPGGVPIPTGSPVANYPYPPVVVPTAASSAAPWGGAQVVPAY
ncbi:MAG: hypothetical protein B7Z55_02130 [Planctomycetales bacterium 12-60-4]|nr:MAG: hypothetical protein B7Z55_02130 [Planctomycetales bacterium 12-60-4]